MLSLNGIYINGQLELETPIKSDKPQRVIVTFLENKKGEDENVKHQGKSFLEKLKYREMQELTKDISGSLVDDHLLERRGDE